MCFLNYQFTLKNDFITSVQSIKCYESENGSDAKEVICKESFCWYQWRDDGNITRGCRDRKNHEIKCRNSRGKKTDCYCDFDNCNKICNNCTDCERYGDLSCNITIIWNVRTIFCPDNCRATEGNLITESTKQVDTEGHSTGESTKSVDGQNTIGATKSCTSKPKKPNEPSTRKHNGAKRSGKTTGGCLRNAFALAIFLCIWIATVAFTFNSLH